MKKPKPPPAAPEPDLRDKIREAEVRNILQKLKDGKTLNAREAQIAEEYADAKQAAKTPTDLRAMNLKHGAVLLGCTVGDLKRIRDAGCPGFPHGRPNIPVIRKWMQEHPESLGGSKEDNLKDRHLLAKCLKLEHEVAVAKGDYFYKDEVSRLGAEFGAQVRAELMLLIGEAPTWQGLDAPILQDKAKAFVHGALERLGRFDVKEAKL